MSRFLGHLLAATLAVTSASESAAESSVLAYLGTEGAEISDAGGTVVLTVPLSQPVPWTIAVRDGPPRLTVGFGGVVWSSPLKISTESIIESRVQKSLPGWSELSLVLREPLEIATAEMRARVDGSAELEVRLLPTTAEKFRGLAEPQQLVDRATAAEKTRTMVALDPGHGGIDPGAVTDDLAEAEIMLSFAKALKEQLVRTGRFDVVLTREDDTFVSLATRLTRARSAGADVFLSLHADALDADAGEASGITIYRLTDSAEPEADRLLTMRHAGDDLIKDVDLSGAGEDVTLALLDVVRRGTSPRSRALQRTLVESFKTAALQLNSRPAREGAYSVLKLAEIPSVLLELGFLSSEEDRARLAQPDWQKSAAIAITEALLRWQDEDQAGLGVGDR